MTCSAVSAAIGHCYPIYVRFRGGKAVAALYGYLFSLWIMGSHAPLVFFLPLCIFLMVLAVSKMVSLSSIVSSVAALIYICFADSHISVICAAAAFAALILLRHRGNIRRIIAGNERKIHWIK